MKRERERELLKKKQTLSLFTLLLLK